MQSYSWICLACDGVNTPKAHACSNCGCPSGLSANDIVKWKSGEYRKGPTRNILSNLRGVYTRLAPCPNCSKLMFFDYRTCDLCGHEITVTKQSEMGEKFRSDQVKSHLIGGAVFIALFVIVYLAADRLIL